MRGRRDGRSRGADAQRLKIQYVLGIVRWSRYSTEASVTFSVSFCQKTQAPTASLREAFEAFSVGST